MQLSQFCFSVRSARRLAAAGLFLALGGPVLAADDSRITPRGPQAPDPILTGPTQGPCDPERDSPNYVGGTDIYGHRVVSAEVPGPKATLDSDTVYPEVGTGSQPIGRTRMAATVTGLRKAMDPTADCGSKAKSR
jgi:hypothetical protein